MTLRIILQDGAIIAEYYEVVADKFFDIISKSPDFEKSIDSNNFMFLAKRNTGLILDMLSKKTITQNLFEGMSIKVIF